MRLRVLDVRLREYHSEPLYLSDGAFEELTSCPVCASDTGQMVIARATGHRYDALELSHCSGCNHSYLSRLPKQDWFQGYYAERWDTGRIQDAPSALVSARDRLRQRGAVRRVVRAARVLKHDVAGSFYPGPARLMSMISGLGRVQGDQFPRGRKLLEIGTGYGAALEFFRDAGLRTYGTEANAHRVASCRGRGLDVVQTSITDLDPVAPFGPFDFVYSSHVFEHLTDLERVMRAVEPLVAPEGFLYVEVPHSPIAEDVVLRSHIPVHLHLFSVASLNLLLRRFGFEPVRMLADLNLHVVAEKYGRPSPISEATIPSLPSDLLHGLREVRDETGPLLIRYDLFHVDISRVKDGSSLYVRSFPYGVMAGEGHNDFVVQVELGTAEDDAWPIEFVHDSDQAPIWVKQG